MEINYLESARLLKVIADPSRLKILDLLSCGELCACDILDNFEFTQPTLSHHMKVMAEAGLVRVRKTGVWNFYSLEPAACDHIVELLSAVFHPSEGCICRVIEPKEHLLLLEGK